MRLVLQAVSSSEGILHPYFIKVVKVFERRGAIGREHAMNGAVTGLGPLAGAPPFNCSFLDFILTWPTVFGTTFVEECSRSGLFDVRVAWLWSDYREAIERAAGDASSKLLKQLSSRKQPETSDQVSPTQPSGDTLALSLLL